MGLLAQFYPLKYPANAPLLVGCVVAYCLLSLAMALLAHYERDAVAFSRAAPARAALVVASSMPRHQDLYTLRLAARCGGGAGRLQGGRAESRRAGPLLHLTSLRPSPHTRPPPPPLCCRAEAPRARSLCSWTRPRAAAGAAARGARRRRWGGGCS